MATLNENITRIEEAKVAIKNAIIGKGVAVEDTALLGTYASKINEIPTGGSVTPTSLDFADAGYTTTDPAFLKVQSDLAYTKQKYAEWEAKPDKTDARTLYFDDTKLVYMPLIDTSNVTYMWRLFENCSSLTTIPAFDTSKNTNCGMMFYGCSSLRYIPQLDLSSCTNCYSMFDGCSLLTSVPLLDLSSCTDCHSMFEGCSSLTTIPQLDTSSCTDCFHMFKGCSSLTSIPQLDLSSCTICDGMFDRCSSLTSIPTNLTTSKVRSMRYMINGCNSLTEIGEMDCSSVRAGKMFTLYDETITTLGGFKNLKVSFNIAGSSLVPLDKLTKQSLMNVINDLGQADGTSVDESGNLLYEAEPKLILHPCQFILLTPEDIKIATDKGWKVVKKE